MKIYPIPMKELKARGAILLENVRNGFLQYSSFLVEGKPEQLQQFLEICFLENAEEGYADFYYSRLTQEQRERFRAGLNPEELQALECFALEGTEVYYPLQAEVLPFLADITARGWLFSTFYFTKRPCTVWGNYDGKYPVFCKSQEEENFYRKLAEQQGLSLA